MLPANSTQHLNHLIDAFNRAPNDWRGRPEAAGLLADFVELCNRLSTYDDMLRGGVQLCVLAAETKNPVLLSQAKFILERFQVELKVRPLFMVVPKSECN